MARRFPSIEWAWPQGPKELLIIAAACPHEARAADALRAWLDQTDFDDVTFAEQRLLVRIAMRFPSSRLEIPERGRIDGIARMLWSKSRIALKAAEPVLQALTAAQVKVLVIKGASFCALDMANLKGRVAHDVDVVIRPETIPAVLDVLDGDGWRADHGASMLYLRSLGAGFHGINFVKAPNGDIDIHSRVYRTVARDNSAETGIWARAVEHDFLGARVMVPCPTDRFTIALAHGTMDSLHHADWIVDCARMIEAGEVDWSLFLENVDRLKIGPHVHIALAYMANRLGLGVPETVLKTLRPRRLLPSLETLEALFLFRARDGHSRVSGLARRFFRLRHLRRIRAMDACVQTGGRVRTGKMRRRCRFPETTGAPAPALVQPIALRAGTSRFRLIVDFGEAVVPRRHYLEINTSSRHLMRVKFRDFRGRGRVLASTEIALPPDIDPRDLWVSSRPAGALPVRPSEEQVQTLGARPVRIVALPLQCD
ncbi:nucleotidyltransferase family protein [Breoghania sp.]|uniref:nucleotidyltransferase family protein n=1 Tax=Breoghania sp. TaxID=2065378 RepID=UPI0029CAA913|nr:nucleotidyltransferase family protein [Breoghania sp.]